MNVGEYHNERYQKFMEKEAEHMPKAKPLKSSEPQRQMRPPMSVEARENHMISLAMDLVEKRLIEGTASSQETTHFLKLGSQKERIEREILEKQKDLIDAKTQNLQSSQHMDEMYTKAIKAMQKYSGHGDSDEYDDEEYDDEY